jgi:transcription initiation factor TFIID subunit 6
MQAAAKAELAILVRDHLTSLVREAICVQRHAKRARFHQTSDDDDGIIRNRLHADDINLALQWRGSNVLYATGTVIPKASDSQKRIDLNSYLRDEMQERPPSEIGLTLHWLSVDGEQPRIPQNPPITSMANRVEEEEEDEEENYNDDDMHVDDNVSDHQNNEDVHNNYNNGYSSQSTAIHRTTSKPMEDVQVRQLLPRLLSEELQLYFSQITLALERGGSTIDDRQAQDDALERVAKDSGLQELVPFWVQYLVQHLHCHMGHPEHCRTLIRLARSLLNNPYLHLELQVCLVSMCDYS